MDMDPILALISIVFGILVIVFVGLLNWIVGIFFILLGIWLVYDYMSKKNENQHQEKECLKRRRRSYEWGNGARRFTSFHNTKRTFLFSFIL